MHLELFEQSFGHANAHQVSTSYAAIRYVCRGSRAALLAELSIEMILPEVRS